MSNFHIVKIKKFRYHMDNNFTPDRWAKENCPSYRQFNFKIDNDFYEFTYKFLDKDEAIIFALHWVGE